MNRGMEEETAAACISEGVISIPDGVGQVLRIAKTISLDTAARLEVDLPIRNLRLFRRVFDEDYPEKAATLRWIMTTTYHRGDTIQAFFAKVVDRRLLAKMRYAEDGRSDKVKLTLTLPKICAIVLFQLTVPVHFPLTMFQFRILMSGENPPPGCTGYEDFRRQGKSLQRMEELVKKVKEDPDAPPIDLTE